MRVIRLDSRTGFREHRFPAGRHSSAPAQREQNGVWSDGGTQLSSSELKIARENNRFQDVLWEIVRAIAVSVGMVILLMAVLDLPNIR